MVIKNLNCMLLIVLFFSPVHSMNLDTMVLTGVQVRAAAGLVALMGAGVTYTSSHYTDDIKVPITFGTLYTSFSYATFQCLGRFSVENQFELLNQQIEAIKKHTINAQWDEINTAQNRLHEIKEKAKSNSLEPENQFLTNILTILSPCISSKDPMVIHRLESCSKDLDLLIDKEEERLQHIERKKGIGTFNTNVDTNRVKQLLTDIKAKNLNLLQCIQSLDTYKHLTQLKIGMDTNNIALAKQKSYRWGIILPIFLPLLSMILPLLLQRYASIQ